VRATPGQFLTRAAATGTGHLGKRRICLSQSHQNPNSQVPSLRPWDTHQREVPPGRAKVPGHPWYVKTPVRWAPQLQLGFHPESGGCFAWCRTLSIKVGSRGQDFLCASQEQCFALCLLRAIRDTILRVPALHGCLI
jgi:hypothetical protein